MLPFATRTSSSPKRQREKTLVCSSTNVDDVRMEDSGYNVHLSFRVLQVVGFARCWRVLLGQQDVRSAIEAITAEIDRNGGVNGKWCAED
eukprot:2781919-Amphidinium_carterae.1